MSKHSNNIVAGVIVYTKGHPRIKDGTKFTVSSDYKSGELVTCVDELKHVEFIDMKYLSKEYTVTIPNWLVKATTLKANQAVYVYGMHGVREGAYMHVHPNYTEIPGLLTCQCIDTATSPEKHYTVPKSCIYVSVHSTNTVKVTVVEKKPLAKDFNLSDEHKLLIDMLKEPDRKKLIDKVMSSANLADYEIIEGAKFYVAIPRNISTKHIPMLMAHTDIQRNVKHPTDDNLQYDEKLDMFSSPHGLGADDRAGCYAIHKALEMHPNKFIIALFDEEEIGCVGSRAFADSEHFKRINDIASCYISIDRRRGNNGVSQIATYGYNNDELFELVKSLTGRNTVIGSSTDCRALSEKSYSFNGKTKVACFNMSCGYDREHTSTEVLYFKELQEVVNDIDILAILGIDLWEKAFAATKPTYDYGYPYNKTTTTTTKSKKQSKLIDEILVDGVVYEEDDIRLLLWYYQQKTGKHFKYVDCLDMCFEPKQNEYARFRNDIKEGSVVAGHIVYPEIYSKLKKHLWIIKTHNDMKMVVDLESEDGKQKATNIPYDWLEHVYKTSPVVTSK